MKLLEYDIAPEVRSFSTTREGGFSEGNYGSFNANSYCGDNIEAVRKNRQLLADELGISMDNLIFSDQIPFPDHIINPVVDQEAIRGCRTDLPVSHKCQIHFPADP